MNVYICSAARTAIGTYGGTLRDVPAAQLGVVAANAAIERAGVDKEAIDEVMFGQVLQGGCGQNVARQVLIGAGLPITTPAMTLNKVCASSMRAISLGSQIIRSGEDQLMLVGGVESMSGAPYVSHNVRWGARMNDVKLVDMMVHDGVFDIFNQYHMGITAENVAEQYGITREMQDQIGYESQMKAAKAISSGRFKDEIVPVEVKKKKETVIFDTDEHCRPQTTLEGLAKLRPAFKKDGTVTAGNASGINDAGAAMIIASEDYVKAHGLKPLVKIRSFGSVGCDPSIMGVGPIESTRQALGRAGLTVADLDLVESNEAFAAQAAAVNRELGFDMDKVNVNGGAIALGHPIGAAGCRITTTLIYEMIKRDSTLGLATMCIGGGMGEAIIVERDELCK
ncbi:acetyl-CoA C-acetyltransferase [Agathobaculum sp. NSJ-28]|uniref:Acetyl-CoA acetyltransferase n=2 Tax=Agathobaculum TaxID=2048137 RepID=A0A923RWP6_9FIRM|nr:MULTISPECIES: acetyl-CoA C-acetyltransferase [Butyricicoccaceae]MBS6883665.1 acetyl-CoA C-acetyltransferase [Clostridiaceae bacterium]SCJ56550.1 Acetyl-CoA acetyltransferase [uncultured Butyricicoccus sp.]MBC5726179.1 acetyl-CoA C-acetyltransferase [Agathobaculum faecis]MCU6790274.1 acetyl-CoA C-acetyltransferase [Agathobaculum ammoniilyticum]WOC76145.1 acetyl-CoA C-acetyltransferase [Intestinibacillus sp. NTUH-41-i26]